MANIRDREKFLLAVYAVFEDRWFSAADVLRAIEDGRILKTSKYTLNEAMGVNQERSLARHLSTNDDYITGPNKVRQDGGGRISMFQVEPVAAKIAISGDYIRTHAEEN